MSETETVKTRKAPKRGPRKIGTNVGATIQAALDADLAARRRRQAEVMRKIAGGK